MSLKRFARIMAGALFGLWLIAMLLSRLPPPAPAAPVDAEGNLTPAGQQMIRQAARGFDQNVCAGDPVGCR